MPPGPVAAPLPAEEVARADGVGRTYVAGGETVHALRDVDLSLQRGEFTAIVGPSGAGKSTLLHILGCLERPTSGRYFLAGRDTTALSEQERSRIRGRKVGLVFQSFNLVPQLSLRENLLLPFLYHPDLYREGEERVAAWSRVVGLSHRLRHRPGELSGGEQQRATVARAMVLEPEILLADEPTGNLDAASRGALLDLFEAIRSQRRTLVIVTHDAEVAREADRVLHLCDGSLLEHEA